MVSGNLKLYIIWERCLKMSIWKEQKKKERKEKFTYNYFSLNSVF